jgi:hypothetical protein
MESARTRTRVLVVLALFAFVFVVLVGITRRPFTRACAGDLESAEGLEGTEGLLGPIEATATFPPGPGVAGKLERKPLGQFDVGVFSYGHDPPRWYADLMMDDACYAHQRFGLGLMSDGTIELRRSHDGKLLQIVGRQNDGTRAFYHAIKAPKRSRMFAVQGAGLAMLGAVILALLTFGLARRVRLIAALLAWPEGIVRDDGALDPIEGGAPIPLGCACREKPGKKILYVRRKAGESGPYREHARRGLADHVELSRAEATRHLARTNILAFGAGLLAGGVALVAFFLAGT